MSSHLMLRSQFITMPRRARQPVLNLAAAPIVVDASMLSSGAGNLLNLVAIAGPNGQILLQQMPAVRLCSEASASTPVL